MSIRERRLALGWSQEDLARHSGLSARTIQRIESGQRAGLESLKSLAAVFETSVSDLMREHSAGREDPDPQRPPMLHEIESEAIEFAQRILNGPTRECSDPLSKIEREALDYAKQLLSKFGE